MRRRAAALLPLGFASLLIASCARPTGQATSPSSSSGEAHERGAEGAGSPASNEASGPGGAGGPGTAGSPAAPRLVPLVASGPSLPEVRIKSFGLHVGGGRNDAEEKEPLLRALERRFPALLDCYRLVDEPGKSGSFGVDLHVGSAGGAPRVGPPRTALKGEEFRRCMMHAFEGVRFERQERPTVVSYSVKFSVGGG